MKLYTERSVRALVEKLREEYNGVVRSQREAMRELTEENRRLRARLSVLEGERGEVSEALVRVVKEGERVRKEEDAARENERKELRLLAEKCRLYSQKLLAKYPDEEDVNDFSAFTSLLREQLGEEEETVFDMEEVLSPKEPLDLGKLCRELGLMEDEE